MSEFGQFFLFLIEPDEVKKQQDSFKKFEIILKKNLEEIQNGANSEQNSENFRVTVFCMHKK